MSMRLEQALREFDEINLLDPRIQMVQSLTYPRELIFSRRVSSWVDKLNASASEPVQLAARAHTLKRWEIPRDRYTKDTAGYHEWRNATAAHAAAAAAKVLQRIGYPDEVVQRVGQLITQARFPANPDAQLLEDADCLTFLEFKLTDYLDQWDEQKVLRILLGTWGKMSPEARRAALGLSLDPQTMKLLKEFISS